MNKQIEVANKVDREQLPLAREEDTVANIGKELLKGYSEIIKEKSYLSHAHKKRCEEFFETIGIEELDDMNTEDMTFPDNDALYTTVVRAVVERAFRPQLVMEEVIQTISIDPSGVEKLKVPISTLRTASDLPDDGELGDPDNDDYTSEDITLSWVFAYEVVTYQLIQQGIIDVVQDQMRELGDAIARKVDGDIIDAIEDAAPSDESNNNYVSLDAEMSYKDLVDAVMEHVSNYARPDTIVTNPLTWANFLKDSNVITALGYNSVDSGSVFPRIQDFLGLNVVLTTQATSENLYLIDSQRTKYFVEGSGIEMLDGRKSGTVNWEVIALKLYGVKIVQPEAVYRVKETTA